MKPEFICHPIFKDKEIINVFRKEVKKVDLPEHPHSLMNKHILFRKKLSVDKFKKAVLKITADDYYKLYINGKFITQGPSPSYPWAYFYNEIEITDYLCAGENVIAVHTYYQGLINRTWTSGDLRQMMWCTLDIDGVPALTSDTTWKCAIHDGYTECGRFGYDTQFAECYDSRSAYTDFYLKDYDDSSWGYAQIQNNADHSLIKQKTRLLDFETIEPVSVEKRKNDIILDFGREAVGYLRAKATGSSGDTVTLLFGEELNEDGSVRYEMRCNCNYTEKWILSGKSDTIMQYDYKAFRYCQLIIPDGVSVTDITLLARFYPYEELAEFPTENEKLTSVIRLCLDTIKYGTQEGYLDCPTREKGAYLGDISIAGRAQAVATQNTDMIKRAVRLFCDSTKICSGMMAVSSASLMQEIADYSLQFAAQILWIYKTDGDIDFLRETEPYATGIYNYFLRYADQSGLLSEVSEKWNLVDWPKNLRDGYDFPLTTPIGPGYHNVINAFWYGSLTALDEIYQILGKTPITGYIQKVKKSFFNTFYCENELLFCDSAKGSSAPHFAIHSNVLPLLFGMADENEKLKSSIVSLIEKKALTSMGVYMAYFTLAALKINGYDELCVKLATDEGCWLNMLRQGGTTTFEAWGVEQKWNTSLFHPWACAPVIIFAKDTLPY